MTIETEKTKETDRKEKLVAMRGARDAMSHALDHISNLESALDRCVNLGGELAKMTGKETVIRSFYGPGRDVETVSAQTLLDEMHKARARVAPK
tara:strand:- start:577 stop:858 length:282 start_codon:yes stop_codon:yes gene_type:complete